MNIKVIGYDPNNIPRVWGIDNTKQMAVFQAQTEALSYVGRRPDTMPISEWTFLEEGKQNDN